MKISIIVPVYNAERYLDKLVQSVLGKFTVWREIRIWR